MKSERTWAELSSAFTKLLERLRQGDFPREEDWALVFKVGTLADAIGRPSPVRMGTRHERKTRQDVDYYLEVESFGPSPQLVAGPRTSVELMVEPGHPCPEFPDCSWFDPNSQYCSTWPVDPRYGIDPDDRDRWASDLGHVARFLEMTWGPLLELAGKTEPEPTEAGKPPAAEGDSPSRSRDLKTPTPEQAAAWRAARMGVSQKEIARQLGIAQGTVSKWVKIGEDFAEVFGVEAMARIKSQGAAIGKATRTDPKVLEATVEAERDDESED